LFSSSSLAPVLLCLYTRSAPPHISTLALHDALPICKWFRKIPSRIIRDNSSDVACGRRALPSQTKIPSDRTQALAATSTSSLPRSEEHTSELQSRENLVCRLLLEKKKQIGVLALGSL